MDDITRKRLEQERDLMADNLPVIDTHGLEHADFSAHNRELEKMGAPYELLQTLGVSTVFVGMAAAAFQQIGTPREMALQVFDLVALLGEDAPYDLCALEEFTDRLDEITADLECDPYRATRTLRIAIAEITFRVEDFFGEGEKTLDDMRALARRVARFQFETIWDAAKHLNELAAAPADPQPPSA